MRKKKPLSVRGKMIQVNHQKFLAKEGSLPEVSRERSRTPTRASPKEVD